MYFPNRLSSLVCVLIITMGAVGIKASIPGLLRNFNATPVWPVMGSLPELKAEPGNVELRAGAEALIVKFTLDGSATELKCSWSQPGLESFATVDPLQSLTPQITITPKTKITPVDSPPALLCQHATAGLLLIPVKILPKSVVSFSIEGSVSKPKSLNLIAGQTIKLTGVPDGVEIKEATDVASLETPKSLGAGEWSLTAKQAGTAELKAVSGGQDVKINTVDKIPVTVVAFTVPTDVTILTGTPGTPLAKVVTSPLPSFAPTVPLAFTAADTNILKFDTASGQFFGRVPTDAATINVTNSTGTGSFIPASFPVRIVERVGAMTIHGATNTIYVGGPRALLSAQLRATDGDFAGVQPQVSWSLVSQSDSQYVSFSNQSGNTTEVIALTPPSDTNHVIRIRASLAGTPPGGSGVTEAEYSLWVRGERNVVDFQSILVRIDMLDGRTAKDLFGPVAPKDYHITKIRIVNDTKAPSAGPGSSIIFFSDALEVRVALEKRHREGKVWLPLDEKDIYYINNWDECPSKADLDDREKTSKERLMRACSLDRYARQERCFIEFAGEADPGVRQSKIAACRADAELAYLACERRVEMAVKEGSCPDDDFECKYRYRFCRVNQDRLFGGKKENLEELNGQWIPFRPYLYQIVANTHDRRDERRLRSRIFLGAEIAVSGTSFLTSFLRLAPGSDLPAGLDKFQNLLIPTTRKLFPSMREVERQNIVSEVLPPLVDLPYGSDVSKYVFFPKRKIEGVLPNYDVRIISISSHMIHSRVGIVQKGNVAPRL